MVASEWSPDCLGMTTADFREEDIITKTAVLIDTQVLDVEAKDIRRVRDTAASSAVVRADGTALPSEDLRRPEALLEKGEWRVALVRLRWSTGAEFCSTR